jgi:uncharacterized protein YbaR (Trm112 family)
MFVDLLDKLRCPNDHEDSPFVAAASHTIDRHILEGTLGCPVCHAEYRIRGGAAEIGDAVPLARPTDARDNEAVVRLAALIGLDGRGGVYVLDYCSSLFTASLAELVPDAQFIVISASENVEGAGLVIRGRGAVLPLAKGCALGIAVDDDSPERLRSAVQVLAPGGRLVAPARASVPDGINELARDTDHWVGERTAVPVISSLRRAPR